MPGVYLCLVFVVFFCCYPFLLEISFAARYFMYFWILKCADHSNDDCNPKLVKETSSIRDQRLLII